jgi:predicted 3-demethylubiquinone-9 3-methyltransferase (glyoxalase superfamily)
MTVMLKGGPYMFKKAGCIRPFLTFPDQAEEAVNYYVSIFPNSKIVSIRKYGKDERVEEGKVLNATFELKGAEFLAMDIGRADAAAFSWAISLFVSCEDEKEFDALFKNLSNNGTVLMGPEPIMGLRKVAWVTDRFGVTWQLVWE